VFSQKSGSVRGRENNRSGQAIGGEGGGMGALPQDGTVDNCAQWTISKYSEDLDL